MALVLILGEVNSTVTRIIVYEYTHVGYPQSLENRIKSPGARVMVNIPTLTWVLGIELWLPERIAKTLNN